MARIAFYAIIAAAISAGRTAGARHESGEYNMDPWLGNAKATSEVLRRHDIRIKKKFGQNFLIDRNILEKIPKAAGITKDDLVLEIGPRHRHSDPVPFGQCQRSHIGGNRQDPASGTGRYARWL